VFLIRKYIGVVTMNILDINDNTNYFIISILDIGIIFGALGIVFLRKIIYSALLLGLVFICIALWYLLLNADFLAAAQVLIYVGAVNVLIVFAIMLVNKPSIQSNKQCTNGDILASSVFVGLFLFLTNMILKTNWGDVGIVGNNSVEQINPNSLNSIETIGIHILTDQLLPFELLSVLLLVALAGAITIARKDIYSG
jgi:NAD(P)H-quinone oxidoreductase subunit 6